MTDTGKASRRGDVHVVPAFGKPHNTSAACWCAPKADPVTHDRAKYAHTIWIHEVQQ